MTETATERETARQTHRKRAGNCHRTKQTDRDCHSKTDCHTDTQKESWRLPQNQTGRLTQRGRQPTRQTKRTVGLPQKQTD